MLTDTGPIVALFDEDDDHHSDCTAVLHRLPYGPLVTTWCCFTEAIYLLGGVGGYHFQQRLWRARRDGRITIVHLTDPEADRMDILMGQYANVPMDLADASLIALAESRSLRQVFTVDSDFYIYRLADGSVLEIVR